MQKDVAKKERIEIENDIEPVDFYNPVKVEESEVMLLASLIESEASGESYYGMCAVACVCLNRMKDGKTLKQVIFQRGQFSGVRTKGFKERKASSRAIEAAYAVLSGERVLGKDYIYFLNRRTARSREMLLKLYNCKMAIDIGNHAFFTD